MSFQCPRWTSGRRGRGDTDWQAAPSSGAGLLSRDPGAVHGADRRRWGRAGPPASGLRRRAVLGSRPARPAPRSEGSPPLTLPSQPSSWSVVLWPFCSLSAIFPTGPTVCRKRWKRGRSHASLHASLPGWPLTEQPCSHHTQHHPSWGTPRPESCGTQPLPPPRDPRTRWGFERRCSLCWVRQHLCPGQGLG